MHTKRRTWPTRQEFVVFRGFLLSFNFECLSQQARNEVVIYDDFSAPKMTFCSLQRNEFLMRNQYGMDLKNMDC